MTPEGGTATLLASPCFHFLYFHCLRPHWTLRVTPCAIRVPQRANDQSHGALSAPEHIIVSEWGSRATQSMLGPTKKSPKAETEEAETVEGRQQMYDSHNSAANKAKLLESSTVTQTK